MQPIQNGFILFFLKLHKLQKKFLYFVVACGLTRKMSQSLQVCFSVSYLVANKNSNNKKRDVLLAL